MSSPVAHSLTGYLTYRLTVRQDETDRWPPLWAYIAMANFPDIDIVFGFLQNTPFQYHHESIANSIGMALGFTLCAWCCTRIHPSGRHWQRAWLFFILYSSHIVLDFFGSGRAVPLLWPLDARTYINPLGFMPGFVKNNTSNVEFVASLIHIWNGIVVLMECAIFLPALYLVERWRGRHSIKAPPGGNE